MNYPQLFPHSNDKPSMTPLFNQIGFSAFVKWTPIQRRSKQTSKNITPRQKHTRIAMNLGPKLLSTYRLVNPAYSYTPLNNPKRALTKPDKRLANSEYDNEEYNYILYANSFIVAPRTKYLVVDLLGTGSFGQVVRCINQSNNDLVALKIIKNLPAYHNQGLIEVSILEKLNEQFDPDTFRMVRLLDHFVFRNHLCLVFELLSINLFDLIKANKFQGLSLKLVRYLMKQILTATDAIKELGIIHCDLKPENILMEDTSSADIKVIDFGSACFEGQPVYSYIQSRFYRSPEVILGLPYYSAIDVWSAGCVCFELFLGLPLFPGQNQHCMLYRMNKALGDPPNSMLIRGKNTKKYYNYVNGIHILKSDEEFAREQYLDKLQPRRDYFNKTELLEDIVMSYPFKPNLNLNEIETEKIERKSLVHFLECMLCWDPSFRWTPNQLLQHPFITEEPLEVVNNLFRGQPIPNKFDNSPLISPHSTPIQYPNHSYQMQYDTTKYYYNPQVMQLNSIWRMNPITSPTQNVNRHRSFSAESQQLHRRGPLRNSKGNQSRAKPKRISNRQQHQEQYFERHMQKNNEESTMYASSYDNELSQDAHFTFDSELFVQDSLVKLDSPRNIFPSNAGYSYIENSYSLDSPRVGDSLDSFSNVDFEGNSPVGTNMGWSSNLGTSPYHSYFSPTNSMFYGQPNNIPHVTKTSKSYSNFGNSNTTFFGTSPGNVFVNEDEDYFGASPPLRPPRMQQRSYHDHLK